MFMGMILNVGFSCITTVTGFEESAEIIIINIDNHTLLGVLKDNK